MADFLISYKKTSINEGGYANHPDDRGGETYKGIARNFHPRWAGWTVVDEYKKKKGFPNNLKTAPGLHELVQLFYKKEFWDIIRGNEIGNQSVADALYDDAVNTGNKPAIKKMQNAAFNITGTKEQVKQLGIAYGIMDDKTLSKLNNDIL